MRSKHFKHDVTIKMPQVINRVYHVKEVKYLEHNHRKRNIIHLN